MKLDLPNLISEPDRHGNDRIYVRVKIDGRQRRIRLREQPGTPEFAAAYSAAISELKAGGTGSRAQLWRSAPNASLGWLAQRYFVSPEFTGLDSTSQRTRRGVIEGCLAEPLKPGSKLIMRDCPYQRINAQHIKVLRDRKKDRPGAANNRKKYVSAMFGWAIEQPDLKLEANPCRDVKRIKRASEGFRPWTLDDVAKFIERHPKGTTAHLALCLLLFLGARRGDAGRLGPKNMREGCMRYVPRKTSYARVEESVKPILPPLAEAIRCTPHGLDTFLVTSHGKPFTDGGLGNKMREWCDQAGLPECTAHGLKKVAAAICANMGATDRQMMMLFDWTSEKMAGVYTRQANKEKLAAECARLLGSFFASSAPIPIENKLQA